jgi:predicted GNAT family acetyltransferase
MQVPDSKHVIDRPDHNRFELALDDEIAIAAYRREGNTLILTHTEVPEALEGQGIASALVAGLLDQVRARHEKVVPLCAFVRAYLERHPEQADLVAG